jgi:hypothetical protein
LVDIDRFFKTGVEEKEFWLFLELFAGLFQYKE